MNIKQVEILQRALKREKAARKAAEKILEEKSRDLYITSQKLEHLLDEKSSQLQGVFENIIDAYVVMDLVGNIVKFNEAASKLFGYDMDKDAVNVTNLIFQEDYSYAMNSFVELQTKGYFKNYEARVTTKSKEVKWVHINASLIFDKDKKPVAAQGIVRDITDQKEAEEQLIESENRLATIILNLDSGVLLEDENRKIVLTNAKFCELFSIPMAPAELQGIDCEGALNASKDSFVDPEGFITRITDLLSKKEIVQADVLTMVNGTILERDYIPIFENNIYRGHLWTYKDVTLNRKYRDSIEAQRQKYSDIIANMNLGLVEVNNDDEILMINQSFEEMSGYTEDEVVGKKGSALFTFEDESKIIARENAKRQKGKSNSYEIKVKNKAGEIRYWLVSGAPNFNLDVEVVGSIGIHLDITEIKNLEFQKEKLLEKLEKSNDELNEYAHVVSHDLKSPLRSIYALVDWIKEDNADTFSEETAQNFSLINLTLEKMEQLISDVLDYSSVTSENKAKVAVNLDTVIQDILQILYVPEQITINYKSNFPTIKGNRARLQQLFQNLISNAIRYTDKEEGLIVIDCQELETHYQFSIEDNGIGIAPEHHEKIFKIFQSLHQTKESTGVGLSIVKKIVNLHEGDIWVESSLGEGATFFFTIKK